MKPATRLAIRLIMAREMKEALRDRTTLIVNYLLPIVFWPVLFLILGGLMLSEVTKERTEVKKVALAGPAPAEVPEALKSAGKVELTRLEAVPGDVSRALELLRAKNRDEDTLTAAIRKVKALNWDVLVVSEREGDRYRLSLLVDPLAPNLSGLVGKIQEGMEELNKAARGRRLASLGLSEAQLNPLAVETQHLETPAGIGKQVAGALLPVILCYLFCLGTLLLAVSAFVAEREKGTLALLISSPVTASDIVLAKFLHVVIGGLASLALHVLSLNVLSAPLAGRMSLIQDWKQGMLLLGFILCIGLFVAALSTIAGILAKSIKQAEGILSVLMLLLLIPMFFVMVVHRKVEPSYALGLIPFLNAVLAISWTLKGSIPWPLTLLIAGTNLALVGGLVAFAVQVFKANSAGFPLRLPLTEVGRDRRPPDPKFALGVVGWSFFSLVYLESLMPPIAAIFYHQLVTFALIPLAAASLLKLDLRLTFSLRLPNARSVFGSILMGLGGALVALCLLAWKPPASEQMKLMEQLILRLTEFGGWPLLITVFALLPALCEEIAFRGAVLGGLRAVLPPVWAVAVTSVLFGFSHVFHLQILPATLMGLVLGYGVIRSRSLGSPVITHFFYNTVLVTFGQLLVAVGGKPVPLEPFNYYWFMLLGMGAVALAGGAVLTRGDRS